MCKSCMIMYNVAIIYCFNKSINTNECLSLTEVVTYVDVENGPRCLCLSWQVL